MFHIMLQRRVRGINSGCLQKGQTVQDSLSGRRCGSYATLCEDMKAACRRLLRYFASAPYGGLARAFPGCPVENAPSRGIPGSDRISARRDSVR